MDASWQLLLDTVNGIPEERLTEAGAVGVWSVKDLLGHIAYWDENAATTAEQLARAETAEDEDWQVLNDRSAAERASWSLEEIRAELERSHAHVLVALEDHPQLGDEHWAGETWEHYDEHVEDLNRWLNRA
jgi:hypothetical protein